MNITRESIVGDIVAQDFRTASVFKANKIDFCCRGNRSIAEVCEKNNLEAEQLINSLNNAQQVADDSGVDFKSWDLDLLADYIEKKHHRYVRNTIPELTAYLNKIAKVHGERHPELYEVESLFLASANDLLAHLEKEEKVLFPFVRQMSNTKTDAPHFGTVKNPIQMMMHEHDNEGVRFRKIAELTHDYTPPSDACTTYRVAFQLLEEFENDLHKHIHLENNILFPKAIAEEQQMAYA